jgi:hypothetical protein
MCAHAVTCLTIFVGIVQASASFGSATDPSESSVQARPCASPSLRNSVSLQPCAFLLADAPLPLFIPLQGVLMVLMNLGVVALPIIELGRFFLHPVRTLMQRCGVLRGDVSTASVGEPADAPADAEVEISEVLRLPIWLDIRTHCSSCPSSGRVPLPHGCS